MDHSAVDSFGFQVNGSENTLFYTGDFRGHGRRSKLLKKFLQRPPEVDILVMEGTTLGRQDEEGLQAEQDVEKVLVDLWKEADCLSFFICSGQNIDRLVSAYRACLQTRRTLVIDIYTAWILKKVGALSHKTPRLSANNLRVLSRGRTASTHYGRLKDHEDFFGAAFRRNLYRDDVCITHEEIFAAPDKYVVKTNWAGWLLDELRLERAQVVHSMWPGYLEERYNPNGAESFQALRNDPRVEFHVVHLGGHAVELCSFLVFEAVKGVTYPVG